MSTKASDTAIAKAKHHHFGIGRGANKYSSARCGIIMSEWKSKMCIVQKV
jgi:hypothetical protein